MRKHLYIFFLFIFVIATACSSESNFAGGGGQTANTTNLANTEQNKANVLENKAAENKTPTANTNSQTAELPKFKKGEEYKSVREKLIKAGWTPFKSKEADKCLEGDERCQDFPEMEACAGTGLGNCRYLWKKGSKTLAIFTISDSPIYDGQEFVKLSQQSKLDKEDETNWQGGAVVHTPPSNVRESPGGKVLCVIREKKMIIVNGSTNITDDDGEWIRTNACGKSGVIHSSQINIAN